MRQNDSGHPEAVIQAAPDANGTQQVIQELLENLCSGHAPADDSQVTPIDRALDLLCDRVVLLGALDMLTLLSHDKLLDVVFQACICAMIGVLNLFLDRDLPYTWRKASMVVAKAAGHGPAWAHTIRKWVLDFVRDGTLPIHCYSWKAILNNEDILQGIQEQLIEKAKASFIKAEDVCEIVASERIQLMFTQLGIHQPSISLSTAHRWLSRLKWRYGKRSNGMYFDGHKRDNVVAYREAFVHRWAEYETCFQFWDDNGNPLPRHSNSVLLILVTHDKLVFFQNDERKTSWGHNNSAPAPKPKGKGQSLMVSDFLTMEWGCLCDGDRCVVPFFLVAYSH